MYFLFKGVRMFNFFKSKKNKESEAEQLYQDALIYGDRNHLQYDPQKCEDLLNRAAKLGHRQAILSLAQAYINPNAIEDQLKKAEGYLLSLTKKGDAKAMVYLSNLYIEEKNYERALPLLLESARLRDDEGLNNLGYYYMRGEFLEKNLNKAEVNLLKCLEINNLNFICAWNLYELYSGKHDTKTQKIKNNKKALMYLEKSADLNYDPAKYELAMNYIQGKFGKRDYDKAKDLLNELSLKGYDQAKKFYRIYFSEASAGESSEDIEKWNLESQRHREEESRQKIEKIKFIKSIYGPEKINFINVYVKARDLNKSKDDLYQILHQMVSTDLDEVPEESKETLTAYALLAIEKGSVEALETLLINPKIFLITEDIRMTYLKLLEERSQNKVAIETLFDIYCYKYRSSDDDYNDKEFYLKEIHRLYDKIMGYSDASDKVYWAKNLLEGSYFDGYKKTALITLEQASAEGNPEADYLLASLYLDKEAGKYNPTRTLKILESDSVKENADAMHLLGKVYEEGIGVQKDLKKAVESYKKSINIKSVRYGSSEKSDYDNLKRAQEKLKSEILNEYESIYKNHAQAGDPESMMILADMYASEPVYQYDKALDYYEKLAKKGNKDAMYKISVLPWYPDDYGDPNDKYNYLKVEDIINDYEKIALYYEHPQAIDQILTSKDYAGKDSLSYKQVKYIKYYYVKKKISLSLGDPLENAKLINGYNNYQYFQKITTEIAKDGYYDVDIDLENGVDFENIMENKAEVLFNLGLMILKNEFSKPGVINSYACFQAAAKKGIIKAYPFLPFWDNSGNSQGLFTSPTQWDKLGRDEGIPEYIVTYHLLNMCDKNYSKESIEEATQDLNPIVSKQAIAGEIIEAVKDIKDGVLDISTNMEYTDEYKKFVSSYLKGLELAVKRRGL